MEKTPLSERIARWLESSPKSLHHIMLHPDDFAEAVILTRGRMRYCSLPVRFLRKTVALGVRPSQGAERRAQA